MLWSDAETGMSEAEGTGRHRAPKRGAGKEDTMKRSILMKIAAALAICAAFPLGATAEPAMLRERYGSAALQRLRAEDRRGNVELNLRRIVSVTQRLGFSSRERSVHGQPRAADQR